MLVPALMKLRDDGINTAMAQGAHAHHLEAARDSGDSLLVSLLAVGVHTAAMFAVAGTIAIIIFTKVGVEVLRRAWINLDVVWAGALVVTGALTLSLGVYQLFT